MNGVFNACGFFWLLKFSLYLRKWIDFRETYDCAEWDYGVYLYMKETNSFTL